MAKLRLITSRSNNFSLKKSIEFLTTEAKAKDREFLVVVPEKFSLTVEKMILLASDRKAVTNIQVVTLSRLLKKLLSSENNYLSEQAGVMVVKNIIQKNQDKLVCFNKAAKTIGFAKEIFDTISQLKNSKISYSDFEKMSAGLGGLLKRKLQDIFLIYENYEEYINGKYIDACDRFDLLGNLIKNEQNLSSKNLYVLGFDFMSESGYAVLKSMLESAESLTVGCSDFGSSPNTYISSSEMLEKMLIISRELNITPDRIFFKEERSEIAKHLSENLFSSVYQKELSNGNVRLVELINNAEEVEFVSKEIKKLVLAGERYKNIAIACPDLSSYEDIIKSKLFDYEIPFFIDNAKSLSSHPLPKFILNAFSVIKKNYAVEEVLSFAKNYFSGCENNSISTFENFVLKKGVNYDGFKKSIFSSTDSYDSSVAESVRTNIISKLQKFEKQIKSSKNTESFVGGIDLLLQIFETDKRTKELSKTQEELSDFLESNATMQAFEKVNKVVEDIKVFLSGCELTIEEFQAIFASGISATNISFIPETIDSVFIGDASTSKFFNIKHLFVVGATIESFPFTKSDCGLIVDSEINSMSRNISKKIEPTIRTINRRERYKVFELLQTPSVNLTISYPSSDNSGKVNFPSTIINEIQKIYKTKISDKLELEKGLFPLTFDIVNAEQKIKDDFVLSYSTLNLAKQQFFSEFANKDYNNLRVDNLGLSRVYNQVYEKLDDDVKKYFETGIMKDRYNIANAERLFFKNGITSPTSLQSYFNCPYKFFMENGLKAKERDEARFKSFDIGNILHKVAEYFVKDIAKSENLTEKDFLKFVGDITTKALNFENYNLTVNEHMVNKIKSEAERMCKALLFQYKSSEFKPYDKQEVGFGKGRILPEIKLNEKISVQGKIDRFDITEKYSRVIDYKTSTSASDIKIENIYYGTKIQLFLYIKAVEKFNNLTPVGAFYLPLTDDYIPSSKKTEYIENYKLKGFFEEGQEIANNMDNTLNEENVKSKIVELELVKSKNSESLSYVVKEQKHIVPAGMIKKISDYVLEISKIAVEQIMSGNILPSPILSDRKKPCDYCEFRNSCGINYDKKLRARIVKTINEFNQFIGEENGEV